MLRDGKEDIIDNLSSFLAELGDKLADQIQSSVTIVELPNFLNCHRIRAEQLTQHAIIQSIIPNDGHRAAVLKKITLSEIDSFLRRLRAHGKEVSHPTEGMVNLIDACEVTRWPIVEIAQGLPDQKFRHVELLPADLKFKSIMVDPVEVRSVLDNKAAAGRLSAGEAADTLNIARQSIQHLISNQDVDGCPFLTAEMVTLLGTSAKAVGKELRSLGIEPILSREKLGAFLYRRSEFRHKMQFQIYGVLQ